MAVSAPRRRTENEDISGQKDEIEALTSFTMYADEASNTCKRLGARKPKLNYCYDPIHGLTKVLQQDSRDGHSSLY